jgi:hypothetical protein
VCTRHWLPIAAIASSPLTVRVMPVMDLTVPEIFALAHE